jgi:DNA adenine methylase
MNEKVSRPLLEYHGGKWRLAPWIISQFPCHKKYVEPYGGGGSVLLRKSPSFKEVYNDLNGEIVNLFRQARDNGDALYRAVSLTPYSRKEFELSFDPCPDDPLEQARRTIIRSLFGFGTFGVSRKTVKDDVNRLTGYSGATEKWASYPSALKKIVNRLRCVNLENRDALEVIEIHDSPETLFYVDPPYVSGTRTGNADDYEYEMSDDQHIRLAKKLNSVEGKVILSGYACPLYDNLYRDWRTVQKTEHTDRAGERTETLWLRNIEEGLF